MKPGYQVTLFATFLCCYLLPNDTGSLQENPLPEGQEKEFGKEGEVERRMLLAAVQQGDIAHVESLIEEIRRARGSLPIDIIEPAITEAMAQTQLEAMLKALVVSFDIAEIAAKHAMETHNEAALRWITEHTRVHPRLILDYAMEHGKRDLITFIEQRADSDLRVKPLMRIIELSRQLPPVFGTPKPLQPPKDVSAKNIPFERGHLPIVFLIDQSGTIKRVKQEAGRMRVSFDARGEMTVRLLVGLLLNNNKLVIASKWVTCAILSYAFTGEQQPELRQIIREKWQLYTVPQTQFTVWMPQDPIARQHYEKALNIDQFKLLPLQGKGDILTYCPPFRVGKNDSRIDVPTYKKSDLFKLFKVKQPNMPLFDFALFGHGAPGHSMAGLPTRLNIPEDKRITSLLTFFNDQLNTNAVLIRSCSAGGINPGLLQMIDDKVSLNYNYLLIVGSTSDKTTKLLPERLILLNTFFRAAATLDRHGGSLNELLRDLATTSTLFAGITAKKRAHPGDIHGYAALPQVWFPGGIGFKALDVTHDALIATKTLVATHEELHKPIEIHDKQIVLWYPLVIKPTVKIGVSTLPQDQDMYRIMDASVWKYMPVVAHDMSTPGIRENERALLYPEFALMNKQSNRIWFKKIELQDSSLAHIGVLQFLRDAFCDVGERPRPMDIVIESLEGINDIPLQAALGRKKSSLDTPGAFEAAWQETAGQRITLHDVMIRINPRDKQYRSIELYIQTPEGPYWVYTIRLNLKKATRQPPAIWQFTRSPEPPIEAFRKAIAEQLAQKSISEILQKKALQIKEMDVKEAQETKERREERSGKSSVFA